MNDVEFLEALMRYQDGCLDAEGLARLERELSVDPAKRRLFAETLVQAAALRGEFRLDAFRAPEVIAKHDRLSRRGVGTKRMAVALLSVGLLLGLAGSGVVWAMAKPRWVVSTSRVAALVDGGFESARDPVPAGFPQRFGDWGGDGVELIAEGASEGVRRLRFARADADANTPQGRAIACDLFQLVDLRGLIPQDPNVGNSVLELSAAFSDARPHDSNPSVSFYCQIYLFRGDPESIHQRWPSNIAEAVASGSASITTLGGGGWRDVTAKCLLSPEADFAVIHLIALPNLRVGMPDGLFVDDVRLMIKTQPLLPLRVVD